MMLERAETYHVAPLEYFMKLHELRYENDGFGALRRRKIGVGSNDVKMARI